MAASELPSSSSSLWAGTMKDSMARGMTNAEIPMSNEIRKPKPKKHRYGAPPQMLSRLAIYCTARAGPCRWSSITLQFIRLRSPRSVRGESPQIHSGWPSGASKRIEPSTIHVIRSRKPGVDGAVEGGAGGEDDTKISIGDEPDLFQKVEVFGVFERDDPGGGRQ